MPAPLNVLFVEPPRARRIGGIETALAGLARALPAVGVRVTRTDEVDSSHLATADVVHFHGLWEPAHWRARRWCARLGKPCIVSPHGMLEEWAFRHRGWKKWPYFHLLEKPSLARARVVLATSDAEATRLGRWFSPERIRVLGLGAEPVTVPDRDEARLRLRLSPDDFTVLFLSRCHEKKGLHLLIAALPEAARHAGRRVHLLIVGEGDEGYVAPLRAATAAWAGNLRATWAGPFWGHEKWDFLAAADLFCLPSFSENFGLAVLEALMAGTPVLTTPATPWATLRGALPVELCAPAVPAVATALAQRLRAAPATDEQRAVTRDLARQRFAWSALAPQYRALYQGVITAAA